jgi:hypothetical protein
MTVIRRVRLFRARKSLSVEAALQRRLASSKVSYRLLAGVRPAEKLESLSDASPSLFSMVKKARQTLAPSFLYRSVQSQIGDVKKYSIPTDKKI